MCNTPEVQRYIKQYTDASKPYRPQLFSKTRERYFRRAYLHSLNASRKEESDRPGAGVAGIALVGGRYSHRTGLRSPPVTSSCDQSEAHRLLDPERVAFGSGISLKSFPARVEGYGHQLRALIEVPCQASLAMKDDRCGCITWLQTAPLAALNKPRMSQRLFYGV